MFPNCVFLIFVGFEIDKLFVFVGNCSAGYYCPQGEMSDSPRLCSVGHYCPQHSAAPVICPSGWFQENVGQSSCELCPGGYYCDNSYGVVLINDTIKCPEGYYCPPGKAINVH